MNELEQLRTQLAAERNIKSAEKQILLDEIAKNHRLRMQLAAAQAAMQKIDKIINGEEAVLKQIRLSLKQSGNPAALDAAIAAATKDLTAQLSMEQAKVAEYERNTDKSVRELIAEAIKPLVEALEKAADTFADLKLGLRLLGNPDVARACEIAEEETRKVIPK